jgi:hypothetical protein
MKDDKDKIHVIYLTLFGQLNLISNELTLGILYDLKKEQVI